MTNIVQDPHFRQLSNGLTRIWPFTFILKNDATISFFLYNMDTGLHTEIDPSLYTITLNADFTGSVTYPISGPALANGYVVYGFRKTERTQSTAYKNERRYYAEIIERSLDKLTAQAQETGYKTDRVLFGTAIQLPIEKPEEASALTIDEDGLFGVGPSLIDIEAAAEAAATAVAAANFLQTLTAEVTYARIADGNPISETLPVTPPLGKASVNINAGGATINKSRFDVVGALVTMSEGLPVGMEYEIKVRAQVQSAALGSSITVASVAAMQDLLKANLVSGMLCKTISYVAATYQGGAEYVWDPVSTATTNTYSCFNSHQGGAGRWLLVWNGEIHLSLFGALNGSVADQSIPIFQAFDAWNADAKLLSLYTDGIWEIAGGWPAFTASHKFLGAKGACQFRRASNGRMIKITGSWNLFQNIFLAGRTFTGTVIAMQGDKNIFDKVDGTEGIDAFYNMLPGSVDETILFPRIKDVGGTGIGAGGAARPMVIGAHIDGTGPEGIQGDDLDRAVLALGRVLNTGGVGAIAGNDAKKSIIMGYISQFGNSGIKFGQKGPDGTTLLSIIANMLLDNDHFAIAMRNYRRRWTITGITRANPCVVTMARIVVTLVTIANPMVITAVAHGLSNGDKTRLNGLVGPVALNGVVGRVKVLSANTIGLWNEELDTPISSLGNPAYVSGGFLDNAFEADKSQTLISGVVGMTEINGLTDLNPSSIVANVITLQHLDGTPYDSTGNTAYVSGGVMVAGAETTKSTILGNVSDTNTDGSISFGDQSYTTNPSENIVGLNIFDEDAENYGRQPTTRALNRITAFNSSLLADANNVTGNSTFYNPVCTLTQDTSGAFDNGSGKFTCPHTGWYFFAVTGKVAQAGGCTSGILVLKADDIWSVEVLNVQEPMLPEAGDATQSNWYGKVSTGGPVYLEKGTKVYWRVKMVGLGADTTDVKAGATFNGWQVG